MVPLSVHWLGEIGYEQALELQHRVRAEVLAGRRPGALLLLTHPHTVTIGRHGNQGNVTSPQLLEQAGCRVHRVDRGGDVTYHGPGQLVGYPIVDLGRLKLGVRAYIERLSGAITAALSAFGVAAIYEPDAPGLWVGRDKLAAFGVHVHKRVTTHGFAVNVCPDLRYYDLIVPCGLRERGVTSLERLAGAEVAVEAVRDAVREAFAATFEVHWVDSILESNIMRTAASNGSVR